MKFHKVKPGDKIRLIEPFPLKSFTIEKPASAKCRRPDQCPICRAIAYSLYQTFILPDGSVARAAAMERFRRSLERLRRDN